MALKDFTEIVERLQKGLGRAFAEEPWMLNLPGRSVACKIDQHYYLAVMPAFAERLGRLAGMFPDQVVEALVRTGNLITRAPERDPVQAMTVGWEGGAVTVRGAFVDAEFIDGALRMYGGLGASLNVSELKISSGDRERLEAFFEGKTPPQKLAYF